MKGENDAADSTSLTSSLGGRRGEPLSPFVQIGRQSAGDGLSISATSLAGSCDTGVILGRTSSRRDRSNRRKRMVFRGIDEAETASNGSFSPVSRRRSDPSTRHCDSGFLDEDALVNVPTITKSSPTDDDGGLASATRYKPVNTI
jgi:hypothetical protein